MDTIPSDFSHLMPSTSSTRLPDITAASEVAPPPSEPVQFPRQTVVTVAPLIAEFAAAHHRLPSDQELRYIIFQQGWRTVSETEADFAVEILRFRGQAYVR